MTKISIAAYVDPVLRAELTRQSPQPMCLCSLDHHRCEEKKIKDLLSGDHFGVFHYHEMTCWGLALITKQRHFEGIVKHHIANRQYSFFRL